MKTPLILPAAAIAVVVLFGCTTVPEQAPPPEEPPMEEEPIIDPAEEAYESISLAVAAGDPEAAIAAYEQAELQNPDEPETRVLLANLYMSAGQIGEAEQILDAVLRDDPGNSDALYSKALIAGARGDRTEKRDLLTQVVEQEPENARAQAALGEVHLENRNYRWAEESFEASLEAEPENFVALQGLGNVKLRTEEPEAAEEYLTQAIEQREDYPFSYVDRGRARILQNRYREAEGDLDRAIELEPQFPWNYLDRGRVRAQLNDLQGAEEDFSRAIELDGDIFLAYVYRARMRDRLDRDAAAMEDYEQAIRLRPDYYPAFAPLGTLYYEARRWEEAHEMFAESYAESETTDHAEALMAALALKRGEENRRAVAYLERQLSQFPRQSLYYHVGRFYVEPSYEGLAYREWQNSENEVEKKRMSFYMAAQYELNGQHTLARRLYATVTDDKLAGFVERRLAEARLAELREE